MLCAVKTRRCMDATSCSGMGLLCLPSTAHLLNVTAGKTPSTREKVHVHATKTSPYATLDLCIRLVSQTRQAG